MQDDHSTTLADLKELVSRFRDDRDWKQFHNPKDLANAISIEAAELLEIFLWKDPQKIEAMLSNEDQLSRIRDELADILNFSLSLADVTGIDIAQAIQEKIKKNSAKYPANKVRGNAQKYNEYKTVGD